MRPPHRIGPLMVFVLLSALLVVDGSVACAANPGPTGESRARKAGGADPRKKENVMIPLRDDAQLAADIWLPGAEGKYPTILIMTPYDRTRLGRVLWDPDQAFRDEDRERYVFVGVDWRGFGGSKAAKQGLGAPKMDQHGKDGYDVVEWIARQPWSDGKVGMWGGSAVGRVQIATAIERPPHLTCIVPLIAPLGYRYEQFYHGGVLRSGYLHTLGKAYGPQLLARAHPTKDKLWRSIEQKKSPERVDTPMLMITGWFDLFPDAVSSSFREIVAKGGPKAREHSKLIIGPWSHTEIGKLKQGELEINAAAGVPGTEARRFFDYWLRGEINGADEEPRVRYMRMGTEEWHTANRWPPARSGSPTVLHLGPGGTLGEQARGKPDQFSGFRYDPDDPSPTIGGSNAFIKRDEYYTSVGQGPRDQRPVEDRSDCAVFTSAVLASDVVLEGTPELRLFVASDRKDTDFAVRLTDVYPDGRSMLVTDGIQRVRYRMGNPKGDLMEADKVYELTVRLSIVAQTFQKGHRIRVVVSSANSPRYEAHTNMERKRLLGPKSETAQNRVFYGSRHPSRLILPVLFGAASERR